MKLCPGALQGMNPPGKHSSKEKWPSPSNPLIQQTMRESSRAAGSSWFIIIPQLKVAVTDRAALSVLRVWPRVSEAGGVNPPWAGVHVVVLKNEKLLVLLKLTFITCISGLLKLFKIQSPSFFFLSILVKTLNKVFFFFLHLCWVMGCVFQIKLCSHRPGDQFPTNSGRGTSISCYLDGSLWSPIPQKPPTPQPPPPPEAVRAVSGWCRGQRTRRGGRKDRWSILRSLSAAEDVAVIAN